MTASVRETRPCHIQITPQHDQFKTRITPKLATAIRSPNLQAQRILRSKSYSCVAERNRTVMVVITLKTILDGKVGYIFVRKPQRGENENEQAMSLPLPETNLLRCMLVLCINFQLV